MKSKAKIVESQTISIFAPKARFFFFKIRVIERGGQPPSMASKKRKAEASAGGESSQKIKHERQRQAYIDSMHNFWQKQLDKIKSANFPMFRFFWARELVGPRASTY